MNRNKRQRNLVTDEGDDNKKKKIQYISTNIFSRDSITHFEDLSNKLVYEISEFLDGYHLYEIFFDLNQRFRNLCLYSNFPIHMNISSLPKPIFQNYYTRFIQPNNYRIISIHLSEPFTIEFFSSLTKYSQLQSLVLPVIESQCLQNLLIDLTSLPNLSSLAISMDYSSNKTEIYDLIFQLPVLKSCKISLTESNSVYLPVSTNPSSPIEYLSINGRFFHPQMDSLLSYVPKLRRLSIENVQGYHNNYITVLSSVLKHLTHVSLTLQGVNFTAFELWIKQYFSQVKVLQISTNYDNKYLDANEWEKLIVEYMPHLHIFDFQYTYQSAHRFSKYIYDSHFQGFSNSFWFERQWFFAYDYNSINEVLSGLFYSIQPYRRKSYTLTSDTNINKKKINFDSVHHVIIPDERLISNYSIFFPNANKLTISDQRIDRARRTECVSIDRIIPLIQLTKLTINYKHRPFSKVIDLLYFAPNVHKLIFIHLSLVSTDYLPLEQSEKFRCVSKENHIKQMTISYEYSLRDIQLFLKLFPKLQEISIGISENYYQSTIEFLLKETKNLTCHLFSICIIGVDENQIKKLTILAEAYAYSIKNINKMFYIWC